jgi:hypothetical protein
MNKIVLFNNFNKFFKNIKQKRSLTINFIS